MGIGLQVGKGLSKDDKAQKLALQHWLEAVSVFHTHLQMFFFIIIYVCMPDPKLPPS